MHIVRLGFTVHYTWGAFFLSGLCFCAKDWERRRDVAMYPVPSRPLGLRLVQRRKPHAEKTAHPTNHACAVCNAQSARRAPHAFAPRLNGYAHHRGFVRYINNQKTRGNQAALLYFSCFEGSGMVWGCACTCTCTRTPRAHCMVAKGIGGQPLPSGAAFTYEQS